MEQITLTDAAFYVAAFLAALKAGWIAPDLVADLVRRRRRFTNRSDDPDR